MRNPILQLTILCVVAMGIQARSEQFQIQFEATISEIEVDPSALNLPFSLNLGQQISGQYIFQSKEELLDILLNPELGRQGVLTLTIDGTELEALINLGTLNDGGSVDINGPPPEPNSSLSLGYSSPTDAIPGWGGRTGVNQAWGAGMVLVGPEGTISTSKDILNVEIWNQLTTLRRLGLQFGYPNTVLVQANVGSFAAVPEPSTAWLACALLAVTLLARS
jgi:hypothetical protein